MMNSVEIQIRVKAIEDAIDDPEVAHGLEDDLMVGFIASLAYAPAGQLEDSAEIQFRAAEVLRSTKLSFPRWCA